MDISKKPRIVYGFWMGGTPCSIRQQTLDELPLYFKNLGIETNFSYGNFLLVNFDKIKGNSKRIFLKLAKNGILVRKMDVYKIKNSLLLEIYLQ